MEAGQPDLFYAIHSYIHSYPFQHYRPTDCGIANHPVAGGDWNCIGPGGWGRAGYLTISDADGKGAMLKNSVLGGCLGGHVWVGTIINTTAADWTTVNGTSKEDGRAGVVVVVVVVVVGGAGGGEIV